MKSIYFLSFFFYLFSSSYAQDTYTVFDSENFARISDAHIRLNTSSTVTHTDNKGNFSLHFSDSDTLIITHIAYHEYRLLGRDLKIRENIYLDKSAMQIEEVVVQETHQKHGRRKEIGFSPRKLDKRHRGTWGIDDFLQFFENPFSKESEIEEITFYFHKGMEHYPNTAAPTLKILLYTRDKYFTPDKNLMPKEILFSVPGEGGKVTINLKEAGLFMPSEGAYIGYQYVSAKDLNGKEIDFSKRYWIYVGIALFEHDEDVWKGSFQNGVWKVGKKTLTGVMRVKVREG